MQHTLPPLAPRLNRYRIMYSDAGKGPFAVSIAGNSLAEACEELQRLHPHSEALVWEHGKLSAASPVEEHRRAAPGAKLTPPKREAPQPSGDASAVTITCGTCQQTTPADEWITRPRGVYTCPVCASKVDRRTPTTRQRKKVLAAHRRARVPVVSRTGG